MKQLLLFVVLCTTFKHSVCECRQSYALLCDTISDYRNLKDRRHSDLVIHSRYTDAPPLEVVSMDLFRRVESLTIIGQLEDFSRYYYCTRNSALKYVNLYANNIKEIPAVAFPRRSIINRLILAGNNIESLEKGAFASAEPVVIDLSKNKIEIIEKYTFFGMLSRNRTRKLILEDNRLTGIEEDSLPVGLRILNVNDNRLSLLEVGVFKNMRRLRSLHLRNNSFSRIPELQQVLPNLAMLDVSHNQIKSLGVKSFGEKKKLMVLNLSHNKIARIEKGTFTEMPLLRFLDLAYNMVSEVDYLQPLLHRTIDISVAFNLLEDMDLKLKPLEKIPNVKLVLYGNPWVCENWIIMERYLIEIGVRRDWCDLQMFSNGLIPFCTMVNKPGQYYRDYNSTKNYIRHVYFEVQNFAQLCRESRELMGCKFSTESISYKVVPYPGFEESDCEAPGYIYTF